MLKAYRLKNRGSFTYIYRKGTSVGSPILTLIFVSAHGIKLGVSVSKKIGKAVVRNKVKRRINECFMRLGPSITGGYNYIAVAKEGIDKATFQEILDTMERLLKKAGHIKKQEVKEPFKQDFGSPSAVVLDPENTSVENANPQE